jgi:hypothetical protein
MQDRPALAPYQSSLFNLSLKHSIQTLRIVMDCRTSLLTTRFLPKTHKILKKVLPSVLLTECFNEENLPFSIEAKNTEIAHLFEHILLEYLCLEKIAKGFSSASFSGRTHWNWIKYPKGSFFITITMEKTDLTFLPSALEKSITLLEKILNSAA